MHLLINRISDNQKAAEEVRNLTGSYYANNNFEKLKTDWILAQEQIQKLVGKEVITRALAYYHSESYAAFGNGSGSGSEDQIDNTLTYYLQVAIAYLATFTYYQSNMVSHEDAGRKVKIDSANEKMAWEWMLDRDDAAQLQKIYGTQDRLLNWLEETNISEWLESSQRIATRELFVNTTAIFQLAYPIDQSPRFYYTITPFIREIQTKLIKKSLSPATYTTLLNYWKDFQTVEDGSGSGSGGLEGVVSDEFLDDLLQLVQTCIPLATMIIAVKRLKLSALPYGVVQQFNSQFQSRRSGQVPPDLAIESFCSILQSEVDVYIDDIKKLIQSANPENAEYRLLPKNDETNKYFRT